MMGDDYVIRWLEMGRFRGWRSDIFEIFDHHVRLPGKWDLHDWSKA